MDGIPGHYLLTLLLNDATEAGVSADFSVPPGWVEHLSDDTLIIALNIRRRVLPEMRRRTLLNATPIATRRSGVAWPPDLADRKPFAGIAVSSSHSNHETAAQAGGMYYDRRVLQQL
ncbi:hypothetical protein O988_05945 [Pseudogymnoascus sp. VKM F-3808]|nr:hypothetical protein O988_05945 [Pseudogymnoascus sp. VKM F-3808]